MKKIALISLCCTALFTACSDDSSTNTKLTIDTSDIFVQKYDDLPVCSDTREGAFAFVKDERQAYTCHNKLWTPEALTSSAESSSSQTKDGSSSSETDSKESSSSTANGQSSSETQTQSSSAESSSSAEPSSSAESSSSEASSSSVVSRDIKVGAYQYAFGGLDFLNLSICNNEKQPIDSLTLRLYVTAKPEDIEATPGDGNAPGTCPLLVDEDLCQMVNSTGISSACHLPDGKSADDHLRLNLRHSNPVKINSSYNASTGEYLYYIPIPLGSIELPPSSRLRIDIGFTSGIYQNGGCETLRTPAKKNLVTDGTSTDWSWAAHKQDIDGADYDGIPLWEKDQGDTAKAPINPYIAIYRKDELISGILPKY